MTLSLTSEQLFAIATIPDRWESFSSEQQTAILAQLKAAVYSSDGFPVRYRNRDTGKVYRPHNIAEKVVIESHVPKRILVTGGEGSGKSTLGGAKTIDTIRKINNGMLASPSLPHFRRSLWSEFVRWLAPEAIIEKHRERLSPSWEPREPFRMVCNNGSYLDCAGIVNIGSIEGPNIHFFWLDEARHINDPNVPKTIEGRVRIPGPHGEPSQWWITTTPPSTTDHWLYTYFGPMLCSCPECGDVHLRPQYLYTEKQLKIVQRIRPDLYPLWSNTGAVILSDDGTARLGYEDHPQASLGRFKPEWLMPERRLQDMSLLCPNCLHSVKIKDDFASFKLDSAVIALLTEENVNAGNLEADFVSKRGESLREGEKDILLWAEWGDTADQAPFLPTMVWWDNEATEVPLLRQIEPMVVALDAATGRTTSDSDCFAILGVTRHWLDNLADDHIAVRFYKTWRARAGEAIDFEGTEDDPGPERILRWLCEKYNVIMVTYDPTELHDMSQRLSREGLAWFNEFSQSNLRYEADRELLTLIQEGRIVHDGSQELREHLRNADRKLDSSGKKLRIVKRSTSRVIDLSICLSMASYHCMRLGL